MQKFPLVTVDEMITLEKRAVEKGFVVEQMMERAGYELACLVDQQFGIQGKKRILGIAGTGNNGGDTLTALIHLSQKGWDCSAFVLSLEKVAPRLVERLKRSGVTILSGKDFDYRLLANECKSADVILDGILGTGIHLPLAQSVIEVLEIIRLNRGLAVVVAVDCPSGIDCRTGEVAPGVLKADLTICLGAVKAGLLTFPAYSFVGHLTGINFGLVDVLKNCFDHADFVVGQALVSKLLPARPADAHKGIFGKVIIIGGCAKYVGAPLLAGKAAYRIGAGLVRLAMPKSVIQNAIPDLPEAVWKSLPDVDGYLSQESAFVCTNELSDLDDVWLIGPGLGLTESTQAFMATLLDNFQDGDLKNKRLVIDADGLRALAGIPNWHRLYGERTVLTPHPGEMAILTSLEVEKIQSDRIAVARKFAQLWGCVLVLKGALTVVANADGRLCVIPGASAALAKAGSGDILAGMIAGLAAQGMDSFTAAYCAAWLHFQCGVRALEEIGTTASVIASDLIESIHEVLTQIK